MLNIFRRAVMSTTPSKSPRPIVAVIGTTGVGKSQLAVSLAQSLASTSTTASSSSSPRIAPLSNGGDQNKTDVTNRYPAIVLSADSMQLYKGLDVITNKVTEEEMGGVDHWGLDIVSPGEGGSWEVGRWCTEADEKIASIPPSTLPIICGGTHYFIQHFLFPPPELSFQRPSALTDTDKGKSPDPLAMRWTPPSPLPPIPEDLDPDMVQLLNSFWTAEPQWPRASDSGETQSPEASSSRSSRPTWNEDGHLLALHQLLCAIDPKEGGRWHWRDGRKVRRGLERWWERGGPISEASETQPSPVNKGRQARFRTLIFWVYEPLEALRPRLDRRVDKMVENGLLREIAELRGIAERIYGTAESTDHTEGIFQSIGYKEFAALRLPQADPISDRAYSPALERTKLSTHQYAKSQLKWIKKQLLHAVKEARSLGGEVEVFVVHGGEKGIEPAVDVLHKFLNGDKVPSASDVGHETATSLLEILQDDGDAKVPDTADRQNINARRDCEACSLPGRPYSISLKEWDDHVKSKPHKRNANPVKRDKDAWIAAQRAQGLAKREEREKLKDSLAALRLKQADGQGGE